MNAAIITARTGPLGQPDKNMYPVRGVPLISYPIEAAMRAKAIDRIYISTDAHDIAAFAASRGVETIVRPDHLRRADVNHGDVIRHAVEWVDAQVPALENVVVLLGNSVMVDAGVLDAGLKLLDARPEVDSCMTVHSAGNDHPCRAMSLVDGCLQPFGVVDGEIDTEPETYTPAYYFDQGAWIFRKETVAQRRGPGPWWWMGAVCVPLVRPWVQGRDVHSYFDLALAEWWVENREKIESIFQNDPSIPRPGGPRSS